MQNPIELAKAHPYITAGGVAVLGIVLILMFSGGTETEQVSDAGGFNPYASDNAAANSALAQSQLGAQVATTQLNNALAAEKDANATAAAMAKENFAYLSNKDVLAAKVSIRGLEAEEFGISKASEVSIFQTAKAAEVEQNKTNSAYNLGLAGFNTQAHIANLASMVENNRITTEANTAANNTATAAKLREQEIAQQATKNQMDQDHRFIELTQSQQKINNTFALDSWKTGIDAARMFRS